MTDADYIRSAKSGDQSAWVWLLQRYHWILSRAVLRAVDNGRDEQDAWSQAQWILVECVRRFRDDGNFLSYLAKSALLGTTQRAMRRGPVAIPCHARQVTYDREYDMEILRAREPIPRFELPDTVRKHLHKLARYNGNLGSLSETELQVFIMLGEGMSRPEIAAQLGLSSKTVDSYNEHIKTKLDVRSMNKLLLCAAVIRYCAEEYL